MISKKGNKEKISVFTRGLKAVHASPSHTLNRTFAVTLRLFVYAPKPHPNMKPPHSMRIGKEKPCIPESFRLRIRRVPSFHPCRFSVSRSAAKPCVNTVIFSALFKVKLVSLPVLLVTLDDHCCSFLLSRFCRLRAPFNVLKNNNGKYINKWNETTY